MNTTEHASSVDALMERLGQRLPKQSGFSWDHTGGGCFAIRVPLTDGGELLITDYDGPLSAADGDSDDERTGWCVGRYDAEGILTDDDKYVYESPVDRDTYTGPMTDLDEVASAVLNQIGQD